MRNNFFLILPLLAGIWHLVVRVELNKLCCDCRIWDVAFCRYLNAFSISLILCWMSFGRSSMFSLAVRFFELRES